MVYANDIIADLHTHTVFSKHAYSTVKENVDAAAAKGMEFTAVTDHYYGSDNKIERVNELARMVYIGKNVMHPNIKIISGVEFNLNQRLHDDVIVPKVHNNCKWRLLGFHSWFLEPNSVSIKGIPVYFQAAISNNGAAIIRPTAFAHIERELQKCAFADDDSVKAALAQIVDLAIENNIVLEINETSILTDSPQNKHLELMRYWISYALSSQRPVMFSFGSDAHYCEMVGSFTNAVALANEMNIVPEQILNHKINKDMLQKLL